MVVVVVAEPLISKLFHPGARIVVAALESTDTKVLDSWLCAKFTVASL